jgi:nicotinamidase-related amidase
VLRENGPALSNVRTSQTICTVEHPTDAVTLGYEHDPDQMPRSNSRKYAAKSQSSLNGNAPDRSGAVLILVDVINDLDFPDNKELVRNCLQLAKAISRLKVRCKRAGIPAVYVNDNYGKWRSDFSAVFRHSIRNDSPGREMVRLLAPEPQDYIILKPKHSAFYATPLETMLTYIGARNTIVTGLTTNACVLLTVADLYVREHTLFVPQDCVRALNATDHQKALQLMKDSYGANTTLSSSIPLARLSKISREGD